MASEHGRLGLPRSNRNAVYRCDAVADLREGPTVGARREISNEIFGSIHGVVREDPHRRLPRVRIICTQDIQARAVRQLEAARYEGDVEVPVTTGVA